MLIVAGKKASTYQETGVGGAGGGLWADATRCKGEVFGARVRPAGGLGGRRASFA